MSRSRRKTPIHGWTTAQSEKQDKRLAHKRQRARTRQAIHHGTNMPLEKETGNPWDMAKDGKQYNPQSNMRK